MTENIQEGVVLTPDGKKKLEDELHDLKVVKRAQVVKDIAEALQKIQENVKEGDIVALSPACASFDSFPNFAARGNYFKELVNKL